MIKATGTLDGRPLLLLGLSSANITRLLADKPIVLDTADLSGLPPMKVLLVAGATEEALIERLTATGAITDRTVAEDHR